MLCLGKVLIYVYSKNLSVQSCSIFLRLIVKYKCEGVSFNHGDLKSVPLVFDVLIF